MPAELVVETTGLLYEQEGDFPEAMPEGQVLTLPMTDADTSECLLGYKGQGTVVIENSL